MALADGREFEGYIEPRGDFPRLWFVATDGTGAEFRADLADDPPAVAWFTDLAGR